MVIQEVEHKLAGAELLADAARELQHAQVTVAHLGDTSIHPRPEHLRRDRLKRRKLCIRVFVPHRRIERRLPKESADLPDLKVRERLCRHDGLGTTPFYG